jgi:hypothetical protein
MSAMRTWTFPEARPKLEGAWSSEPDKAQWVDEATGLDCLVNRNRFGAWCGYVGLPPEHPLYGKGYGDDALCDLEVHGGLNFADTCQEGAEDGWGVCHVPEPGRPAEVWWLGFDCGHFQDLVPGRVEARSAIGSPHPAPYPQVYRTFDYVRAEVRSLAAQLARAR